MGNPLLDRASARELAERGQVIEKKEKLDSFPRLVEAVAADLGRLPEDQHPRGWRQLPVAIRLAFGRADDRQGLPSLTGEVAVSLPAVCQRCLEPLTLSLAQTLKLLLTTPDTAMLAGDGYEAWEIDDPVIRPADIVEETLLMAMPFAPMHDDRHDCGLLTEQPAPGKEDTVRPFAGLRSQMRTRD